MSLNFPDIKYIGIAYFGFTQVFKEFCDKHFVKPPYALLDLGCGHGKSRFLFGSDAQYTGADILELGEPGFNYHRIESKTLPFSAESFDIVFSNFVIEYVEDKESFIKEIYRVLKPGGAVYIGACGQRGYISYGLVNFLRTTEGKFAKKGNGISEKKLLKIMNDAGFSDIESKVTLGFWGAVYKFINLNFRATIKLFQRTIGCFGLRVKEELTLLPIPIPMHVKNSNEYAVYSSKNNAKGIKTILYSFLFNVGKKDEKYYEYAVYAVKK